MQELRLRARHRLIGAVALMVVAVIVFPLLFDTEQRPAVIDAPVVIADAGEPAGKPDASQAVPAPVTPAAPDDTVAAGTIVDPTSQPSEDTGAGDAAAADEGSDEAADGSEDWALGDAVEPLEDDQGLEEQPTATRSKIRVRPAPDSGSALAASGSSDAAPAQSTRAGSDAEARRALAALQGRSPAREAPAARSTTSEGAFVVQVGAFSQDEQVRRVQQQIASTGLKSYTQVVQTGAGPRTRVRVGPYDSRDAAERARATLEKGGLPGQVLSH